MRVRRFSRMRNHFVIATPPVPFAPRFGPPNQNQQRWVPDGVMETEIPSRVANRHGGQFPYADEISEANSGPQKRYIGYVFRSDKRSPLEIETVGGFWPHHVGNTRHDGNQYQGELGAADFCMNRHSGINTHTPFISTSQVASKYICNYGGDSGYLYALLVEGGLNLGRGVLKEILVIGAEWADIVAYKKIKESSVWVRSDFPRFDPVAWLAIFTEMKKPES